MNDDLTTLASAYLDGDVSADERAQVEASPELLAEVDRLRTVRAVLSNASSADHAPISMRERHLSSALDAWDRLPDNERTGALRDSTPSGADGAAAAGVAAMSSPTRRSTKRRWAQSPGWLGMAAAGLVVVLAGGLVLRNTVGDNRTDDDAASSSAEVESRAAGGSDAVSAPAVAADAVDQSQLAEASPESPADTTSSETGSDTDVVLDAEAPPPDDAVLEQLETADDLALFASDAIDAPASADLPEGASVATDVPAGTSEEEADMDALPLCQGADVVVGLAMYGQQRVVVAIDQGRNVALAYLEDDCSFVARASLS